MHGVIALTIWQGLDDLIAKLSSFASAVTATSDATTGDFPRNYLKNIIIIILCLLFINIYSVSNRNSLNTTDLTCEKPFLFTEIKFLFADLRSLHMVVKDFLFETKTLRKKLKVLVHSISASWCSHADT